jgi:hypothetical protein
MIDYLPGQKISQIREGMAAWAEALFGCSIRITLGIAEIATRPGDPAPPALPLFETRESKIGREREIPGVKSNGTLRTVDDQPPAKIIPQTEHDAALESLLEAESDEDAAAWLAVMPDSSPIAKDDIATLGDLTDEPLTEREYAEIEPECQQCYRRPTHFRRLRGEPWFYCETHKPEGAIKINAPQPEENGDAEPIEQPGETEGTPDLPAAIPTEPIAPKAIAQVVADPVVDLATVPGPVHRPTAELVDDAPPPPRRRATPPPPIAASNGFEASQEAAPSPAVAPEIRTWLVYPKGKERPLYAVRDATEEGAEAHIKANHPVGWGFDLEDDTTDFARREKLWILPTHERLAEQRVEFDAFMASLGKRPATVPDDPEDQIPTGPPRAAWLDQPVTVLDLVKRELVQCETAGIKTLEQIYTLSVVTPGGFKDEDWSAIVGEMRKYVHDDLKARQERGDDIEEELTRSLFPDASATARWASRRASPRTDDEVKEMVGHEWGSAESSYTRFGYTGHNKRGGKNPAIWVGVGTGAKPTLTGSALTNRVRTLLQIPKVAKPPKPKKGEIKAQEEYALDYQDDVGAKYYSVVPGTLANAERVAETIRAQGYAVRIRPMSDEIEQEIGQAEEGAK